MLPVFEVLSSCRTKRLQVPFGLVELKAESVAAYGPAGAGAGKVSLPWFTSVGLYVPEMLDSVRNELASSSNVNVTVVLGVQQVLVLTSDMSNSFCPAGPTRRMSRTPRLNVLRLTSVSRTRSLSTAPTSPETLMVEG
jgi:hypothetical protein